MVYPVHESSNMKRIYHHEDGSQQIGISKYFFQVLGGVSANLPPITPPAMVMAASEIYSAPS